MDKKVNRVIASCKTKDQLLTAIEYIILALKAEKINAYEAAHWGGVINGIAFERGYDGS